MVETRVPVRGRYQDDLDIVRKVAASIATEKKFDPKPYIEQIRSPKVKEELTSFASKKGVFVNKTKTLTKTLAEIYSKTIAGSFSRDNIMDFAKDEAKSLNKGIINPSLIAKNKIITELDNKLDKSESTVKDLSSKVQLTENKLKLTDQKLSNLSTNVKNEFDISDQKVETMKDRIISNDKNSIRENKLEL